MVIQIIKLKSNLAEKELMRRAKERIPRFETIPGLIEKYYVRTAEEGQYAGVYIWESRSRIEAFKASNLAKSIPEAYEVIEAPNIEILDVLMHIKT